MTARAQSGRAATDVTIEALRRGELEPGDVRIDAVTLEHQAQVAEQHANPELAENFRRAAELTRLPDEDVLAMYEALRPGRSTAAELERLSVDLQARQAPRCAELFRQAATVYARRGLTNRTRS